MSDLVSGEFVLNDERIAVPIIIAREKRKIFPGAAPPAAAQRACFACKVREFNSVQPRDLTVLEVRLAIPSYKAALKDG